MKTTRRNLPWPRATAFLMFTGMTLGVISAQASTFPFSTGNGDTTCGDADANWIVQGSGINGGVAEQATVLSPSCQNWWGGWVNDNSLSSWIGTTTPNPTGPTPYTFTLDFFLASPTSDITGNWSVDDDGTLNVNGNLIDTEPNFINGVAFDIPVADLVAGTNSITVVMVSDNNYDDGVRVQFDQTLASAPEPAAWMLLCGGVAFAGARRRYL